MATESKVALQEIVSTNPADGSVVGRFPVADSAQIHAMVERARAAQPAWNQLGVRKRIQILRRFQRLLHEQKTQVAELISREAGKPVVEALLTEVLVVLDAVRFLRKHAYRALSARSCAARQSDSEGEAWTSAARSLWRDRDHLAMELSVFDPRD